MECHFSLYILASVCASPPRPHSTSITSQLVAASFRTVSYTCLPDIRNTTVVYNQSYHFMCENHSPHPWDLKKQCTPGKYTGLHMIDDCWDFNVAFSNCSAILARPPVLFILPMIKSMGVKTTEQDLLQ